MIAKFVKESLDQDVGRGDLYALVEPSVPCSARIIAKSDGMLAGKEYIDILADLENFEISWEKGETELFKKGDILLRINGDSHTILKIERTLLNILLHASSIATLTKKYVDILKPYDVKLLDTRKTRPLLRNFEKYATRCGGAVNHRMGLDDSLMIKDTHLKTIKDLKSYIANARKQIPFTTKIEVEAENFESACNAMACGTDIVMCDNMTPSDIKKVVNFKKAMYPHILLEASGNVSLENIESYAKTGIDAVSTGAITHQVEWIDISMKMD